MKNKKHNNKEHQINPALQPFIKRSHPTDKTRCRVTFFLPGEAAPDASSVAVAGSFNGWVVDHHLLARLESGDFCLDIELPTDTEHQFRFVIDGVRWENAWNADKYVWCDYGQCENSVIVT